MEEKIEELFNKYSVTIKHGMEYPKVLTWGGWQKAAAEIAKQVKAEKCELEIAVEVTNHRYEQTLAQLAEMQEILQRADEFIINRKPGKGGGAIVGAIRKVLAAVPEVKSGRED